MVRALGALVVALAIQVGTNYANDYSDGIRGTDDARVGPVRLTASGLAPPGAVRRAALLAFGVAGVVGLGLAWATSLVDPAGRRRLPARRLVLHRRTPALRLRRPGRGLRLRLLRAGGHGRDVLRPGPVPRGSAGVGRRRHGRACWPRPCCWPTTCGTSPPTAGRGKRTLAVRVGRRAGGWCYVACVGLPFLGRRRVVAPGRGRRRPRALAVRPAAAAAGGAVGRGPGTARPGRRRRAAAPPRAGRHRPAAAGVRGPARRRPVVRTVWIRRGRCSDDGVRYRRPGSAGTVEEGPHGGGHRHRAAAGGARGRPRVTTWVASAARPPPTSRRPRS